MKTICWTLFGAMLAAGAIAQDTNGLPDMPAPVTSPSAEVAPAAPVSAVEPATPPAKPKKRAVKKIKEPAVTLAPGTAEVAANYLNVRGQAGFRGEALAHLTNGEAVTVFSEITLARHQADEPAQWAKIALPDGVKTWVSTQFIDATNNTVLPKKLNLRAGPGENYGVIGVIERGTPVSAITTRDGWMQIEAPTNAYAFVAAMYLKQESSGTMPTNIEPSTETETAMTTNSVAEPEPILTGPPPVAFGPPANAVETNAVATAPEPETNAAPVIDTNAFVPPVENMTTSSAPRIVSHEGVVAYTISPNAPTNFKLYDPRTYQIVDYLYKNPKDTNAPPLDLNRYVNMRIIVTGAEGLDERWPNTPVITIQDIKVLDTNAVPTVIIKHKH